MVIFQWQLRSLDDKDTLHTVFIRQCSFKYSHNLITAYILSETIPLHFSFPREIKSVMTFGNAYIAMLLLSNNGIV